MKRAVALLIILIIVLLPFTVFNTYAVNMEDPQIHINETYQYYFVQIVNGEYNLYIMSKKNMKHVIGDTYITFTDNSDVLYIKRFVNTFDSSTQMYNWTYVDNSKLIPANIVISMKRLNTKNN